MTTTNGREKARETAIRGFMTKPKALEILKLRRFDLANTLDQDFCDALSLGIHALEMVINARRLTSSK
jgi:hypothetical protein